MIDIWGTFRQHNLALTYILGQLLDALIRADDLFTQQEFLHRDLGLDPFRKLLARIHRPIAVIQGQHDIVGVTVSGNGGPIRSESVTELEGDI